MSDENEKIEFEKSAEAPVMPESVADLEPALDAEPVANDKPLRVYKTAMVAHVDSPDFVRPAVVRLFAGARIVAECAAFKGKAAKSLTNGEFVIVRPE